MDILTRANKASNALAAVPAVAVKDVFKIYREGQVETVALRGVSLSIQSGERIAIVGPSGSGKSTLLSLMGGLDMPNAGQVWVGDQNISQQPETIRAQLRRQQIGFVFQDYNLIPFLTAVENVEMPLLLAGASHSRQRAVELLHEVGLTQRLHHRPTALSGGEQQRVGIACALANQPSLLLADEPTGELDSPTAHSIMELLVNLNQSLGTTIIIVTHDLELTTYAQRVISLRDGLVVDEESHHD